jgi:hypothetical protein
VAALVLFTGFHAVIRWTELSSLKQLFFYSMKNDIEILEESLKKYKDQNGRKAMWLKDRIRNLKALVEMYEKIIADERGRSNKMTELDERKFRTAEE